MFVPFFQAKLIKDIIKGFDISIFELDLEQFIRFLFIGGGREGVHIAINKCMKKTFENTAKGCLVKTVSDFTKIITEYLVKEQGSKALSESSKGIPIVGYFIGAGIGGYMNYKSIDYLGKKTIDFCVQYSRKIGSLNSLIERIETFSTIFKDIEELSLKENWWDYKAKIIK